VKKDGRYRYTLQFGMESEEQIRAGELLEKLGNGKSTIIVAALNEYLDSHPELQAGHCKIEVKVSSTYNSAKIEQLIRTLVEEKISELHITGNAVNTSTSETSEALEDDIAQMLDNLDMFM